jgi:ABC-2 type transport system permease protein
MAFSKPNWVGIKTLCTKEIIRFLKVYNQTIMAPLINALLLLAVFSLAMEGRVNTIAGVPFAAFMASGLVMMSIIQHSFANTSSVLIMGKVLGSIVDYLMPPLTAGEMIFSIVVGGVARGLVVGVVVTIAVACFAPISLEHVGAFIFYAIAGSTLLALIGILSGVFAESFDQMHAINTYVITPLAFLSGTFYSVKRLPEFWYQVSQYNPFFYLIDGMRYSLTGYHDGNLMFGVYMICGLIVALWTATYIVVSKGYRLKT